MGIKPSKNSNSGSAGLAAVFGRSNPYPYSPAGGTLGRVRGTTLTGTISKIVPTISTSGRSSYASTQSRPQQPMSSMTFSR